MAYYYGKWFKEKYGMDVQEILNPVLTGITTIERFVEIHEGVKILEDYEDTKEIDEHLKKVEIRRLVKFLKNYQEKRTNDSKIESEFLSNCYILNSLY